MTCRHMAQHEGEENVVRISRIRARERTGDHGSGFGAHRHDLRRRCTKVRLALLGPPIAADGIQIR